MLLLLKALLLPVSLLLLALLTRMLPSTGGFVRCLSGLVLKTGEIVRCLGGLGLRLMLGLSDGVAPSVASSSCCFSLHSMHVDDNTAKLKKGTKQNESI